MTRDIDGIFEKHKGDELPPAMVGLPHGDLLLRYQARTLEEIKEHAVLVVEKSRRVGETWAVAADAVLTAGAARGEGGDEVSYISYNQEMTREFIDACAMWAKAFAIAGSDVGEFLFADQDEHGNSRDIKAFRITFASGFEIVALSSAPRSLRGRKGKVIIDEAAFVDSLGELLKAALALLMWGGRVIVLSTHNGVSNPFNQLIDDIKGGKRKGKVITITLADAIADGLYERIVLVTGKPHPGDRAGWEADIRASYGAAASEELDCVPAEGGGAFLHPSLITAAHSDDCAKPELYTGGLCVAGRDIARIHDLDCIWVFELVGDILWLRERSEARNELLTVRERIFRRIMKQYNMLRAGVDQSGLGIGEVERAVIEFGDRVVGITFSSPARLDLALASKKRFEDGTIRIFVDPAVRADLSAIKQIKGTGDVIRLVNDGEVHADMFWACALACKMAEMGVYAYTGYQSRARVNKFDEKPVGDRRDFSGRMRMRADERPATPGRFGKGTTW